MFELRDSIQSSVLGKSVCRRFCPPWEINMGRRRRIQKRALLQAVWGYYLQGKESPATPAQTLHQYCKTGHQLGLNEYQMAGSRCPVMENNQIYT